MKTLKCLEKSKLHTVAQNMKFYLLILAVFGSFCLWTTWTMHTMQNRGALEVMQRAHAQWHNLCSVDGCKENFLTVSSKN